MPILFEPTNSFCYRFARYTVLPEIIALPEVQAGQTFRLVDMVGRVVDKYLLPEQQAACYARAQTGELLSVIRTIKWYVPFLAKKTEQLLPLGGGTYRLPDAIDVDQAEVEDSALEDGEPVVSESEGFVYAFSFPALIRPSGDFPIKIGRTAGDVIQRIALQCRGSATFDNPTLLGSWRVERVLFVEVAIHKMLAARGKWREKVPGTEWFDTTIDEIKSIIDFTKCLRH
jgi:hypothetical protein